ncbi:MAG: ATP-binding protein [Candidatus Sumerlaeaceae bacterium]
MTETAAAYHKRLVDLLNHVGHIVSSSKNLDTMLIATVNLLRTTLNVDRCSILIVDPVKNVLRMKAASGIPYDEWAKVRVKVGEGISGSVAASGKALVVADIRASQYASYADENRYGTFSFICAPLIVKSRTIGVINVNNQPHQRPFQPEDLELVSSVSGLVALAIDNARLLSASSDMRTQLENIVETLPQAVLTVTLAGRITLCNMRLVRMLALPQDAPTEGRDIDDLLPEPLLSSVKAMQRESVDYAVETRRELEFTSAVAGTIPVEINVAPINDANGTVNGTLVTLLDVSLRREITELRRVDELKSNFVSLISHELRTPLTAIKGAVHLLLNPPGGPATEPQKMLSTIVHNNTERLIRLVNDLLDMVSIENHTMTVVRRPEHLQSLIDACITAYKPTAESKGIQLNVKLADATAPVDRHRLHQAVCHLLDNAIKFTPKGGTIYVTLESFEDRASITVEDNGCGLTVDSHEKLFSKFFQAQDPLTRSCGGTGIGLFMARSIAELHGGRIFAGPPSNKGASFTLEVPTHEGVLAGSG